MPAAPDDALLGRIAVHFKILTQAQLDAAVDAQVAEWPPVPLGDYLIAQRTITADQLQWLFKACDQFLAKQQRASAPAAPSSAPAATSAPKAQAAAKPVPAPAPEPKPAAAPAVRGLSLDSVLSRALETKASDVHIHAGAPIQLRINGVLKEMKSGILDPESAEQMVLSVLDDQQRSQLLEKHDLDAALQLPLGRFRASMFKQQRGFDAVFRPVPPVPPSLEKLGLPPSLKRLTEFHQGLVLITGPAGCGKSSTLAALVDIINQTRHDHIITVEDPIEYVHASKGCVVNQRQVGRHTLTFANALRAALREDPDVIVIGELRDLETISLAITAAETGHLVLGTLHTNNAVRTINRILDAFPPKQQSQIRAMVSESLRAIISQRLLPSADGSRRVAAVEALFVKPAVSNLIRDEKTFQIRGIMQTGRAEGMCLLDDALAELVKAKQITLEVARRNCDDPKRFGAPA